MSDAGGNSWVIGAMGDSTSSNGCTPTGMTNVSGATTGDIRVSDTDGGVTSWSTTTCTIGTSSTWVSATFEIVIRQTAPIIPLQRVQTYSSLSNINDTSEEGNYFTFVAPNPVPAGNFVGLEVDWELPSGCTTATSCEPTIVDCTGNQGTCSGSSLNTYSIAQTCTNTSQSPEMGQQMLYVASAAANTQSFVVYFSGYGAVIENFHLYYVNLKGIASSPIDGTPSCTENTNPSSNSYNNVTAGSITTTTSGDLIWATSSTQNPGGSNGSQDVIPGTGFALTTAVNSYMNYAQELYVQPSAGAINPGFGWMQTPSQSQDYFGTMAVALKTNSSNGSGISGMYIADLQQDAVEGNAFDRFVFPCTGNLCIILGEAGSAVGDTFSSVTTFPSQTWASIAPATNQGWILYDQSATADSSLNGVAVVTTTPGVATDVFYMNIVGANSTALDPSASCGGSTKYGTGTCYNLNGSGLAAIGQATATAITSSQTTIPLTGSSTCTNGAYAILDTGTSTEVVEITAGCGTSSLTVTRANGTVSFYYTTAVAHAGSVYLFPSNPGFTNAPNMAPSAANGLVFIYENQGTGPPVGIASPAHFLQIWYWGEQDNSRLGNGDGIALWQPSSTSSQALTWDIQNGAAESPGSGTTWQAAATSFLAAAASPSVTGVDKHRKLIRLGVF
jgi:hypothetical protein